jgi:hypothetical protein
MTSLLNLIFSKITLNNRYRRPIPLNSSSFLQRLYGNGRAFQGSADGQADRDLSRVSAVPYSPAEKSFYRYPFDLGDSPEHQNFIVFDIFENQGEGLKSVRGEKPLFASSLEKGKGFANAIAKGAATAGKILPESTIGGALAAKVQTIATGKAFTDIKVAGDFTVGNVVSAANLVNSGLATGSIQQLAAAGKQNIDQLGKGEEGFVQEALGLGGKLQRANKTVFLYMPGGVNAKYSMKYSQDTSFSTLDTMATGIQGGIKNLMSMATNGQLDAATKQASEALSKQLGMGTVKQMDEALKDVGEKLGLEGDLNLKKYLEAGQRRVQNPFVLQLFESVERRTFDFDFEFIPKSQREVDEVYSIIRTFKRYSLPSRSYGGRFLDYPAEFRLTFVNTDKENLYLSRMARCALTDITLKYGTNPFTTFRPDEEGAAPTQITMSLSFSEMEILTQDRIDQGF